MFARTIISSAIVAFSFFSTPVVQAAGTPIKAPDNILSTFEGFDVVSAYTSTTTSLLGTVYVLKSDVKANNVSWDPTTVQEKLQLTLFMSGKTLGKRSLGGVNHQRLDETAAGARNQCVAFVKAMTGIGATSTWIRGTAVSVIFPNAKAPSDWQAQAMLQPGTMIAYFDGQTTYQNLPTSHVAIVKYVVSDTNGNIQGAMVYDQNGMDSVVLNAASVAVGDAKTTNPKGGTVTKHFIPWSSISTRKSFSLKNYHVVTD